MIKIISVHDSYKHYEQPIIEFTKRLWKGVEMIKLKPSKKNEVSDIVKEESQKIYEMLSKEKGYKILLHINSPQLSTETFAKMVEEKQMKHSDVVFVIWGAYGVDYDFLKEKIHLCLSFSPMTFPHPQALMMLLEQVYRVSCMKKGVGYHH